MWPARKNRQADRLTDLVDLVAQRAAEIPVEVGPRGDVVADGAERHHDEERHAEEDERDEVGQHAAAQAGERGALPVLEDDVGGRRRLRDDEPVPAAEEERGRRLHEGEEVVAVQLVVPEGAVPGAAVLEDDERARAQPFHLDQVPRQLLRFGFPGQGSGG